MKRFLFFIGLIFTVTLTAQISETPIKGNLIINGDFRIAQRGTSFASPASGSYTLDRWIYAQVGDMRHTISQDANVPTLAQAGITTQYSLKIDCTTADASIAVGDACYFSQRIEGYNIAPYVGRNLTLSFWVSAPKTGIYCIAFRNGAADRSYIAEYTINSANIWEKKTIILPMNYSGGTWNYTNSIGLIIDFILACGSNFQTSANAWQTGNYLSTSNQVNACDSTDNNFWLANVKLEPGSVATKYEPRMYADELRLCQRYAVKLGGSSLYGILGRGIAFSSTQATVELSLPVSTRVPPSAVSSSGALMLARGTGTASSVTGIAIPPDYCTNTTAVVVVTVASGLTDGNTYTLITYNDANAALIFTSEL